MRVEFLAAEGLEFHAQGEAALEFGNEVRGLAEVERARRDEQNMIGMDHAVLGIDHAAFHHGQKVALHAFARDVRGALLSRPSWQSCLFRR